MKAKHFTSLRRQCHYYMVQYRSGTWHENYGAATPIFARSEYEAAKRYSRKYGSFINNIYEEPRDCSEIFARYRVTFRQRVTYWQ